MNKTLISLQLYERSDGPLYQKISDLLRQQIASGELAAGARLPPTRSLAADLGISRTSVVAAYDQLKAEGYLVSRQGSGVRVSALGEISPAAVADVAGGVPNTEDKSKPDYTSSVDMRLFPYREWAKCVSRVARLAPRALVDSADSFGDPRLRESIARYLLDWRGMSVSAERVIVTAGSIEALEVCIRTLISDGDSIGLENPGYLPLRNFVRKRGIKVHWMQIDAGGAVTPKSAKPRLVTITPSHQYPLGGAMTPARRFEFIAWAKQTDAWIVEDDYDSEFRYAGKPIPALSSLDSSHRSIYVGSFAKIFSIGLRLGFLVVPADLVGRFRDELKNYATKASISMQRPLSEFMDSGLFYRHLRRVRRIYSDRRRLLLEALRHQLGDQVRYDDHQAGMQIVIALPTILDDTEVASEARKQHLHVSPLSSHYNGAGERSGLLVNCCVYNEREIAGNVSRLASIINNKLSKQTDS